MHASVRRWKLKEWFSEVEEAIEEEFIPRLKEIPGFVSYYFVQTGPEEATTVSIFETREGAEESSRFGRQWGAEHLGARLAEPPEIREGEVLHSASGEPSRAKEPGREEQPSLQ